MFISILTNPSLLRTGPRLPSYYYESTPEFSEDFLRQIADGTFVGKLAIVHVVIKCKMILFMSGHSTCNDYTSMLGSGQNVLSYTYYTPWRSSGAKLKSNGRPNDQSGARYAELLQHLARTISSLYPGWRMRIYHNVTDDQPQARKLYKEYHGKILIFPRSCFIHCF